MWELGPVPGWLAGAFAAASSRLVGLIAVLGPMFVSRRWRFGPPTGFRDGRCLGIAGLHALVLLAPPLLSTEIFSYIVHGRNDVLYGANAYLHGPSAIALDPLYPFIGARWVSTRAA